MILRALLLALVAFTGVAMAQQQTIETKIQELRERLALTPEQEQKITPLLEARNAKLRDLRAKTSDDASRAEKMALLRQAKAIQKDFDAQLEPILSKEQMKEWQQFREEAREAARERYRNRQN
jgi:hypothetical protein